jgi:hypothetical protein
MSITEELQFSVLSAPLGAADRRLFSQAWYSALYQTRASAATQAQTAAAQAVHDLTPARARAGAQRTHESIRIVAPRGADAQRVAGVYDGERRAPRLLLAQRIARFVLQPRGKKSGATFTIDGARGRVRVLVRTDGSRVRLIAVCAKSMKATVAAALAQARYALASRGAGLTASIRESETC